MQAEGGRTDVSHSHYFGFLLPLSVRSCLSDCLSVSLAFSASLLRRTLFPGAINLPTFFVGH